MLASSRVLRIALVAGAALFLPAPYIQAQENVCAAQDKRQACSFQCCGRRSCPPSCEVDCVKACVDACAAPGAQSQVFAGRLRELQIRCGNRSVR